MTFTSSQRKTHSVWTLHNEAASTLLTVGMLCISAPALNEVMLDAWTPAPAAPKPVDSADEWNEPQLLPRYHVAASTMAAPVAYRAYRLDLQGRPPRLFVGR